MKKTKEEKPIPGKVQLSKKITEFYAKYQNKFGTIKT